MATKPTVPEVLPLVQQYYAKPGNECGGSLHIVLDDGNVETEHVAYCQQYAKDRGDDFGYALAGLLLRMSKTQRLKLYHSPRRAGAYAAFAEPDSPGGEGRAVMERALTLRASEGGGDWFVIEWAEHEHRYGLKMLSPGCMAMTWTGRVADADVEGTAAEMAAIATAIERGESANFYRCEAQAQLDGSYLLSSPRNSQEPARISAAQARHLAAEIRKALPPPPAALHTWTDTARPSARRDEHGLLVHDPDSETP